MQLSAFLLLLSTELPAGPAATHPTAGCCARPVAPEAAVLVPAPVSCGDRPAPGGAHRRPVAAADGFTYSVGRGWWLMGGLHLVPSGRPLDANTSPAVRTTFTQTGLGLGYMVSPTLRLVSDWHRGVGAYSVSPGSQFTVGIAFR